MPSIIRHRPLVALAAAILALGALITAALASEDAELNIIGFSKDGTLFAFEEFGLQSGSGLPFSNLYVVDLPSDRWVRGTPFRAMLSYCRVEMWRGGVRFGISVSAPFVWRCPSS